MSSVVGQTEKRYGFVINLPWLGVLDTRLSIPEMISGMDNFFNMIGSLQKPFQIGERKVLVSAPNLAVILLPDRFCTYNIFIIYVFID